MFFYNTKPYYTMYPFTLFKLYYDKTNINKYNSNTYFAKKNEEKSLSIRKYMFDSINNSIKKITNKKKSPDWVIYYFFFFLFFWTNSLYEIIFFLLLPFLLAALVPALSVVNLSPLPVFVVS